MVDLISSLATLVLAGVTVVLVYVTYTLRKATDHLARATILPMLVIEEVVWPNKSSSTMINIANRGFGIAREVNPYGITPQGVRFLIEKASGYGDIAPQTVKTLYVDVLENVDLGIEIEYKDAEGNSYTFKQTVRTPIPPPPEGKVIP